MIHVKYDLDSDVYEVQDDAGMTWLFNVGAERLYCLEAEIEMGADAEENGYKNVCNLSIALRLLVDDLYLSE